MTELEEFVDKHFPEHPKKLIEDGYEVPFPYLIGWYQTYGCNNWRKMNGLPLLRGKLNK